MQPGNTKRILIFSDWFLPGFKAGGPIRSIANLTDQVDAQYDIVTRSTDHHSEEPYPNIPTEKWVQRNEKVRVWYTTEKKLNKQVLQSLLSGEEYHRIYFNSLFSFSFALKPLKVAKAMGLASKIVLAPRGMLKKSALAEKAFKKKIFLFLTKSMRLFEGIVWHATNETEQEEIQTVYGKVAKVRVAPNLPARSVAMDVHKEKKPNQLKLVSIARISPEKGIEEAILFLKALEGKTGVELRFYGVQQNEEFLKKCVEAAKLLDTMKIEFLGEIDPSHISTILQQAHFLYAPTRGENFGHSIAEAFLAGTPVVISDQTPWRNLAEVKAGWDLPLKSENFAPVLEKCYLMDQTEYSHWCKGAFAFGQILRNNKQDVEANVRLFDL
jgi:glycosyltransferase involved in cell wall biosynthesis